MSSNSTVPGAESGRPDGRYRRGTLTASGLDYCGHHYHHVITTIFLILELRASPYPIFEISPGQAFPTECWFRTLDLVHQDVPDEIFVWNPQQDEDLSLPLVGKAENPSLSDEKALPVIPSAVIVDNARDHLGKNFWSTSTMGALEPAAERESRRNMVPALDRLGKMGGSRSGRFVRRVLSTTGVHLHNGHFHDPAEVSALLGDLLPLSRRKGYQRSVAVEVSLTKPPEIEPGESAVDALDTLEATPETSSDTSCIWVRNPVRGERVELPNVSKGQASADLRLIANFEAASKARVASPYRRARAANPFASRRPRGVAHPETTPVEMQTDDQEGGLTNPPDIVSFRPPTGVPTTKEKIERFIRRSFLELNIFEPSDLGMDIAVYPSCLSLKAYTKLRRLLDSMRRPSSDREQDHG